MIEKNQLKEWSSSEELPWGFTKWLKEIIRENETRNHVEFRQIASELGVKPSILSRWIAGMGPLTHVDIQTLAANLNPVVYTFLGLPRPIIDETLAEDFIE